MTTKQNNLNQQILQCFLKAGLIVSAVITTGFLLKGTPGHFIFLFTGGWLLWTFAEYTVHRFLMHELILPGKKDTLFHHQEHHSNPGNLKIGFIHRAITLGLGIGVFWFALKVNNSFSIFAGFFTGFLLYNFLHYLLHQPVCKYILPRIQRAHILHHTRFPNQGYSFSTILWDWLFDTLAPDDVEVTEKMKENYFNAYKNSIKKVLNPKPTPIMETQLKSLIPMLLILSGSWAIFSCVPVFSDLQSARTVGKGQFEVTPYYTNTGSDSENDGASHLGANLAFGVSDKVDLRGRFERNWLNGSDDTGITVIGFGPKVSLLENRIAAFLPVGAGFANELDATWQMHPTMLFTFPFAKEKLEATVAPKYIIGLCDGCGGNFASNFGLGYSSNFKLWAVRAEYGRILQEEGVGQFSLGFSFNVNPKN
jgi:hypothetical protein